jgi:hypothetical protein
MVFMLNGKMSLCRNKKGNYDLLLQYGKSRSESNMAWEFFSRNQLGDTSQYISSYIKDNADGRQVDNIRLVSAGVVVAEIPTSSYFEAVM